MMAHVSMCNDVIRNRIVYMSQDILKQVKISLQLDELTDVSHFSQLIALDHYV